MRQFILSLTILFLHAPLFSREHNMICVSNPRGPDDEVHISCRTGQIKKEIPFQRMVFSAPIQLLTKEAGASGHRLLSFQQHNLCYA